MAAQEHRNCDLVCERGGAFSVLEEHDFHPQNVAGTSAGAITAALIAVGYTPAELKDVIFGMDFIKFRDTAWEGKLPLAGKGVSIVKDLGIYEGRGAETFSALATDDYGDDPRYRYRLQVIAFDTRRTGCSSCRATPTSSGSGRPSSTSPRHGRKRSTSQGGTPRRRSSRRGTSTATSRSSEAARSTSPPRRGGRADPGRPRRIRPLRLGCPPAAPPRAASSGHALTERLPAPRPP